jgi:hypothetical protein
VSLIDIIDALPAPCLDFDAQTLPPSGTEFGLRRQDGETWLAAALRRARPWGLEVEVKEVYEQAIGNGESPAAAAYAAVMEWDVAEIFPEAP